MLICKVSQCGSWCYKTLQSLKSKSFIRTNKFFFGLKTLLNDLMKLFRYVNGTLKIYNNVRNNGRDINERSNQIF